MKERVQQSVKESKEEWFKKGKETNSEKPWLKQMDYGMSMIEDWLKGAENKLIKKTPDTGNRRKNGWSPAMVAQAKLFRSLNRVVDVWRRGWDILRIRELVQKLGTH